MYQRLRAGSITHGDLPVLNAEHEVKRTQIALMVPIENKRSPEQLARLRQLRAGSITTPVTALPAR